MSELLQATKCLQKLCKEQKIKTHQTSYARLGANKKKQLDPTDLRFDSNVRVFERVRSLKPLYQFSKAEVLSFFFEHSNTSSMLLAAKNRINSRGWNESVRMIFFSEIQEGKDKSKTRLCIKTTVYASNRLLFTFIVEIHVI